MVLGTGLSVIVIRTIAYRKQGYPVQVLMDHTRLLIQIRISNGYYQSRVYSPFLHRTPSSGRLLVML